MNSPYQSLNQTTTDPITAIKQLIDKRLNNVWTCVVGTIVSYNTDERTVNVQPSIMEAQTQTGNIGTTVPLPQLMEVPIITLYGGQFEMLFPITEGDECLVFFSTQCIDNWWINGGQKPQNPFEIRKFDLSDGFALTGVFSQKVITSKPLQQAPSDCFCLRPQDDSCNLKLTPDNFALIMQTANGDKKPISELIIDKSGNYAYTIYNGDNKVSEDLIDTEGVHTHNIYDGSSVTNVITCDKGQVDIKIKDNKCVVTVTEDSVMISVNNQGTVTVQQDTFSVEVGTNKIEAGSSGIKLDNGTCKIEIGSANVNINGGALTIMA